MDNWRITNLLKRAACFESLAQNGEESSNLSEMINQPLKGRPYSFHDVAYAVFGIIEKKKPGQQEVSAAQGPVYQLMNLMSSKQTLDPSRLLSLSQAVVNMVKEMYPVGSQEIRASNYLVRLAQMLINKYPAPSQRSESSATESPANLVSRVYAQLQSGQPISGMDRQKIVAVKSFLRRRLNGLNGLATRTPAQEQERTVIQFVLDKV